MKKLKRTLGVVAVVLALVLNLCVGLGVMAEEPGNTAPTVPTGSITVTNDPNTTHVSINGKDYSAYRVFDLVQNADHSAYAYTLNENFTELFKSDAFKNAFPNASVDEGKTSTIYAFVEGLKTAADIEKFANVVFAFATDKENPVAPTSTVKAADEKAEFTGLPLGYYLILGNGTPVDPADPENPDEVVSACILDTTTWDPNANDGEGAYTLTINVKVGIPTSDKKIVENKDENDENLLNADSVSIGDTVNFRVTSAVPDLTGYTEYTFTMTDTMSKGLTFNPESMVVKIGDTVIPAEQYVLDYNTADDGVTTIELKFNDFYKLIKEGLTVEGQNGESDEVVTFVKNQSITFDYSATLNADAVVGEAGNPNEAKITYTRDPHTGETNDTDTTIVKVYTFEFDVYKYTEEKNESGENAKIPLAGAEFELTKAGEDAAIPFVLEEDGTYRVATDEEKDNSEIKKVTTVVSGEDGMIKLAGLGKGDYVLTETKAPDGYNKLENTINVSITPVYKEPEKLELESLTVSSPIEVLKETTNEGEGDEETVIKGVKTGVLNTTGTELPSTGGMGTTILYVVGGLLILAAVIGFTVRKVAKQR